MNRRELLRSGAGVISGGFLLRDTQTGEPRPPPASNPVLLRIRSANLELAPGILVRGLTCNHALAGPLIPHDAASGIGIDVRNDADSAIDLHGPWMGQVLRVAAGGRLRTQFQTVDTGIRYAQLTADGGTGSPLNGLAGRFLRRGSSMDADQTHHLSIHHWLPSLTTGAGALLGPAITYRYATLGDKLLQAAAPIDVREGERVRFHLFNASPTKSVTLSLPNHRFQVTALDGHPVPRPLEVKHVSMGPGERVEALVHMNSPGRYILGSIDRHDRHAGLGRLLQYAHARGPAVNGDIERSLWDYAAFGSGSGHLAEEASVIEVQFSREDADATPVSRSRLHLDAGRRYRLSVLNATGERHCVALRGHTFELRNLAGIGTSGIIKDTLALPPFARTEFEFVAASPVVELVHGARFVASVGDRA